MSKVNLLMNAQQMLKDITNYDITAILKQVTRKVKYESTIPRSFRLLYSLMAAATSVMAATDAAR
jgi:hypothetical protein